MPRDEAVYQPRDALSEAVSNELSGLINARNGIYSAVTEWVQDSARESFFGVRHGVILRRIESHRLFMGEYAEIARRRDDGKLQKMCEASQRRNEDAQYELREWKRVATQPLTHRQRDPNRRQQPQRDYVRSCTRLLAETNEMWNEVWERGRYYLETLY